MHNANNRLPRISGLQFGTMVTAGYMAMGVFYFPRELVTSAGRDGIWGLWLDGLVTFILMALSFKMSRLVPNETFGQFSSQILSKPVGFLVGLFTIAYHMLLAIVMVVQFTWLMDNDFLPGIPTWAIKSSLMIASVYMAWFGAAALGRVLQTGYIPMVVLSMATIGLAGTLIRHPILLLPPGNIQLLPLLQGSYRQYFIFIGFEVSITLYPFMRQEERQAGERYAYGGLVVMMLILTAMYEVCMATYGPAYIPLLRWPIVTLMRTVEISGFFINKWGSLVIVLWTVAVLGFMAVRLWCTAHDLATLFFVHATSAYPYLLLPSALVIWVLAILVPNAAVSDYMTQTFLIPGGLLYLTLTPLLVLTVAFFRKKRVHQLRVSSEDPTTPGLK
ncbi:GerAB/ArcD/ProY family transporter [Sulfobacillus sp. hq2]|uniref:GerAB/ArcD/ProY family transporter n=1 Tax=Sulfobacillus TaxID=28033 RepID=UPI000CD00F99|nr:GerAB/ArcD/ProY family transporter [Sulfobacillus sp. hq2]POB11780.1 spore gernimation protein [Sulfobacillus sp. hq2]